MSKIISSLCAIFAIAFVFVVANMSAISDADESSRSASENIEKLNIQINNVQHNVDTLARQMKKIDEKYD